MRLFVKRQLARANTLQERRVIYSLMLAATSCVILGASWFTVFLVSQNFYALALPAALLLSGVAAFTILIHGTFKVAKHFLVIFMFAIISLMALFFDIPTLDENRTMHEWFIPAICFCLLIFQNESKLLIFLYCVIGVVCYLFFNLTDFGFDTAMRIEGPIHKVGNAINSILSTCVFLLVSWVFLNDVSNSERKLSVANTHIKHLMRRVFPHQIAQQLEDGETSISRRHDNIVVIFIDIVGFTTWCESSTPIEIVKKLDAIFKSFDVTIETLDLCKIKTIGDAYLIAGGIPQPISDPVDTAIDCSKELLKKIKGFGMDLRVGIHIGEVVAGVVGEQRQVYDIWGDTVNTAARIEAAGKKGSIILSKQAVDALNRKHNTKPYLTTTLKGKSESISLFELV